MKSGFILETLESPEKGILINLTKIHALYFSVFLIYVFDSGGEREIGGRLLEEARKSKDTERLKIQKSSYFRFPQRKHSTSLILFINVWLRCLF